MTGDDRDRVRADARRIDEAGRGMPHSARSPDAEDDYWRRNWHTRPYTDRTRDYEHYRPAYRFGWESRDRYPDLSWDEIEPRLATEWTRQRDRDRLTLKWDEARLAARDAWRRLERPDSGESTRESRWRPDSEQA